MRIDLIKKQIIKTKNRVGSWNKALNVLLNRSDSRLFECILTLILDGHNMSSVCEILEVPYHSMVQSLYKDKNRVNTLKSTRYYRKCNKIERKIKSLKG